MMQLLTWLSAVVGVIGLVLAYHFHKESKRLQQNRYSWDDVYLGVRRLFSHCRKSLGEPHVVVTVAGSGAVIGNLFAKELSPKRVPVLQVNLGRRDSPWDELLPAHRRWEGTRYNVYIPNELFSLPKEARIAIVDSTMHTGTTLEHLTMELRNAGFANVITLVLVEVELPGRTFTNFYSFYKNSSKKIFYPWGEGT